MDNGPQKGKSVLGMNAVEEGSPHMLMKYNSSFLIRGEVYLSRKRRLQAHGLSSLILVQRFASSCLQENDRGPIAYIQTGLIPGVIGRHLSCSYQLESKY